MAPAVVTVVIVLVVVAVLATFCLATTHQATECCRHCNNNNNNNNNNNQSTRSVWVLFSTMDLRCGLHSNPMCSTYRCRSTGASIRVCYSYRPFKTKS